MIFFCPKCWQQVGQHEKMCRHCGTDLDQESLRSFPEKLIAALDHPEPSTPIRAARILSQIGHTAAVPTLLARARKEIEQIRPDPYLIAACLRAAAELGASTQKVKNLLRQAHSDVVRRLVNMEGSDGSF